MSKNKYDEKRGVCRVRWHEGSPPDATSGPVLVETWKPNIAAAPWDRFPRIHVSAQVEVCVKMEDGWKFLRWNGLFPVNDSGREIRRYARLPSRHWWGNLTVDGWNAEDRDDG